MMIIFLLIPLLSFFFSKPLHSFLTNQSNTLHKICLKILPSSDYLEVNQALVCGENLKTESIRQLFIDTGLYHLIVVSGSHLILIATALEWIFQNRKTEKANSLFQIGILLFFIFYTLICGLEPPLVRACFTQIFLWLSRSRKLYFSDITILFLSILFCLFFEPKWIHSLSLLLSATASLSLIFIRRFQNLLMQQFVIYLCLFPVLFGWGNLHPLTILINVSIAPIFTLFLLPLAVLTIPFPFLRTALDWFYNLTFDLLKSFSLPVQSFHELGTQDSSLTISKSLLWIYFISLCVIEFSLHLQKYRDHK